MTPFETALLIVQSIQAVLLGVVAYKYAKAPVRLRLGHGRSRLKVVYWWLHVKDLPEPPISNPESYDFEPLIAKLESSEPHYYEIEDTVDLVSKQKSIIESFTNPSIVVEGAGTFEIMTESGRMGGIRPPQSLQRPPVHAVLAAVDIQVV